MKKKTVFIITGLALLLSIGIGIRSYASPIQLPSWLAAKQAVQADHDKNMNVAKSKSWAPQPDQQKVSHDVTGFTKLGIFPRSETPMLPLPGTLQDGLSFTNVGYTPYDLLMAGATKSDANHGILLVSHIDKKTGQQSLSTFEFKGKGSLTLTAIQGSNVMFQCSDGEKGVYNLESKQAKIQ